MFGRSGQMFPRQRTFHDAIYEEEYGSDSEDECCRCRGLSAILCWFLSVIILVGLAATVVLTVFFILRSRTLMAKPDVDLDVEMYGKDQNLFEGGGGSSKELVGGDSPSIAVSESGIGGNGGGGRQRKKIAKSKNDVDGDINEEQNAISDSSEDASVQHTNHHTHNGRRDRLQPYSPATKTTTPATPTSTRPVEVSEEELESSEEEGNDQGNDGEGSSLFNLFSGPKNPSFNTPNKDESDEEESHASGEQNPGTVISAESSQEYKSTKYPDGAPVQQVLFTESPKVTTTPNPYNGRRNLQTTRFPTGRTSFSTTTTQMPPRQEEEVSEEVEEEVEEEEEEDNNEPEQNNENVDNDNELVTEDESREEEAQDDFESQKEIEKSSEEGDAPPAPSSPTSTSIYVGSIENEQAGESEENQLKQMLLDSIPPHGNEKDNNENEGSSSEFNLAQRRHFTTSTTRPTKATKPTQKSRQDTLTRLISRNYSRNGAAETETSTIMPSVTTLGPAGHKYDFTMTPIERTKLKIKSGESVEEEVVSSKAPPKSRYRSTTSRPRQSSIPPSTNVPRTRGTTLASSSNEWSGIKLGDKRGSVESPIDIVPSPDLSRKNPENDQEEHQTNSLEGVDLSSSEEDKEKTSSEQQFLDVLVGSDDQKTLVTKKTEDGVVTSAILPPWYDANGSNSSITDVLAVNGTSLSNSVAKVEDETLSAAAASFGGNKGSESNSPASNSEFERLVNMFSKQEGSSEEVQTPLPPPNRFGFKKQNKPIVLKKPGGQINTRYIPNVPGRANLYPSRQQHSSETSFTPTSPTTVSTSTTTTKGADHGDIGRTGALPTAADVEAAVANSAYYPENNGINSDKVVEQHHIESERLSSDEIADSPEGDEPSHIIDVNFEEAAGSPAEIIIEQDSSAPVEDDDGEFVEDEEYEEENEEVPQSLSMAASQPNQKLATAPIDYLRGGGIRKPVSSEENLEVQASNINITSTLPPSTMAPVLIGSSVAPQVIRRPAYTREEIAKSSVKPSPESNHLNEGEIPVGSGEGTESGEFEEYEDDNYEGGSMEQTQTGSVEQWSNEKITHRWSAPDNIRDGGEQQQTPQQQPQNFASEELGEEEPEPAKVTVTQAPLQNRLNPLLRRRQEMNTTFKAPEPVKFHDNKLSFSAPLPEGDPSQYHSKDGWRPLITEPSNKPADSQEAASGQTGSFEPEFEPTPIPQQQINQQLYTQEPMPQHHAPLMQQQQQQTQQQPPQVRPHRHMNPAAMIPPPVSATIKFPDSEEDHEDRRHHGRHRPRNQLYMSRPVPPPIVMRRHPHSTGPFPPPPPLNNRQGPPPPPPGRSPQMLPQPTQQNPQFAEPPPPPSQPQLRPPINRNFHIRPNPMRRFNFGGPPQAQPRSGGNIKWPTEDNNAEPTPANNNAKANIIGKRQNIESFQSEVSVNNKRRRRRTVRGVGLHM